MTVSTLDSLRNQLSRRLHQAGARIDQEVESLRQAARDLTPAECEGDAALCNDVQTKLRLVSELLILRFSYLKVVPWSFCKADEPEGAAEFIRGATSRPSEQQDPLTNYLHEKHRKALMDLAQSIGGEPVIPDPALVKEVLEVKETPLDESAGEGYHRSTNHTQKRASAAKSPYIKQSTRTKDNIKLLKSFLRMGPQGKRVVRFEWRNWRRILQVNPRGLWRNKKLTADKVFKRVYRMDAMAECSWSADLVHAPGQGPAPARPETVADRLSEELHAEYMTCVLQPRQWYRISVPRACMGEDGQALVVQ